MNLKTVAAIALLAPAALGEVTFEWATVGNAGNAPDESYVGHAAPGVVNYEFRIAKHEVTNAQYVEFLNAVDPTGEDSLCLYHNLMAENYGGIERSVATGAAYAAKAGREQNPVTYVDWFDAVRFANWLHNGQGDGSTETGAYTLLGGTCEPEGGIEIDRNPRAVVFLPSHDEWYKAAYHDASAGTEGRYFDYPTGTDVEPYADNPSHLSTPDDSNVMNIYRRDSSVGYNDGFATTGTYSFPAGTDPSTNAFTDVGAFPLATSPYGTYDQGGSVWEWTESLFPTRSGRHVRIRRGGGWFDTTGFTKWNAKFTMNATVGQSAIGFRVASALPLTGDINGDGVVNFADFLRLSNRYGQTCTCPEDLDGDGTVAFSDFLTFSDNFGAPHRPASIPEPDGLYSILIAGFFLASLSRRRNVAFLGQRSRAA